VNAMDGATAGPRASTSYTRPVDMRSIGSREGSIGGQ
jgi:hypothetical protein